nr:hypothetical protein [Chloroflexaceae bacterium]
MDTDEKKINDEALSGFAPSHPLVKQYLESLSVGSRRTLLPALQRIAYLRSNGKDTVFTHNWESIDTNEMLRLQQKLLEEYKPATVNKMMSALRGVLRYLPPIPSLKTSSAAHKGRMIGDLAIKALLGACAKDRSPLGARDAALIAVFLGAGLRRSEAISLKTIDYSSNEKQLWVYKRA